MKPRVFLHYTGTWVAEIGADIRYFDTWREAYDWAVSVAWHAGAARILRALKAWT